MKYVVTLGGERRVVTVSGSSVELEGETLPARIEELDGTPVCLVTIGAEVHRVVLKRGAVRGEYSLSLDGHRFEVEAMDERMRAVRDITAAAATHSGPAPVVAPMPGLIVRVSVATGDQVQAGQGVVVMEAMKMENELRAPAAGVVKAIHVSEGTAVEKGKILLELADPAIQD